ncbi:hypothetical protein [Nonomuraea antri]|nr:hypothetical protein [Nonomuraea antri]
MEINLVDTLLSEGLIRRATRFSCAHKDWSLARIRSASASTCRKIASSRW